MRDPYLAIQNYHHTFSPHVSRCTIPPPLITSPTHQILEGPYKAARCLYICLNKQKTCECIFCLLNISSTYQLLTIKRIGDRMWHALACRGMKGPAGACRAYNKGIQRHTWARRVMQRHAGACRNIYDAGACRDMQGQAPAFRDMQGHAGACRGMHGYLRHARHVIWLLFGSGFWQKNCPVGKFEEICRFGNIMTNLSVWDFENITMSGTGQGYCKDVATSWEFKVGRNY